MTNQQLSANPFSTIATPLNSSIAKLIINILHNNAIPLFDLKQLCSKQGVNAKQIEHILHHLENKNVIIHNFVNNESNYLKAFIEVSLTSYGKIIFNNEVAL